MAEEQGSQNKKFKSLVAHETKKKITVKGLGEIVISRCSAGDIIDAYKQEGRGDKEFTIFLLSRVIQEPKYTMNELIALTDEQIEEIGRKWLEFEEYYLKYFKNIDSDEKTKSLDFYKKFKLTIKEPQEKELEKFRHIAEGIVKENQKMLKSFSDVFRIPPLSNLIIPKGLSDTLNLGKLINAQISQLGLGEAIKKAMIPDVTKGFAETLKSSKEIASLQKKILNQSSSLVGKVPSFEIPPNPQWETLEAVKRVGKSLMESNEIAQKIEERFVLALEEQNKSSRENIGVQKQIRSLQIWLIILTVVLVILTAYLIFKPPSVILTPSP